MKELSIEEKAKAYDNIIEKANKMHCENCEACQMCIEELIPELKESEDERIRKHLIKHFGNKSKTDWNGMPVDKIIAWLEKQGEQKPAWSEYDEEFLLELSQCCDLNKTQVQWLLSLKDRVQPQPKQEWSEEDERIKDAIYDYIYSDTHILYVDSQAPKGWLNSLKDRIQQKYEWSEEDEIYISDVLWCVEQARKVAKDENDMGTTWCAERWIKSLRPRSQWKPSDKHYELEEFARIVRGNLTGISKAVQKLFEAKYLQLTGNKMYGGFKD